MRYFLEFKFYVDNFYLSVLWSYYSTTFSPVLFAVKNVLLSWPWPFIFIYNVSFFLWMLLRTFPLSSVLSNLIIMCLGAVYFVHVLGIYYIWKFVVSTKFEKENCHFFKLKIFISVFNFCGLYHYVFKFTKLFLSSMSSSVTQSCPTLCNPMNCSPAGFHVNYQLSELTQTHVRRVSDAIQLFHPLSSPSPACNLSQHQSFPMSQFFASGGYSIGVSALASVLSMIFRVAFL